MSYIGKFPASAALTASDITDGIISSAKIADGTIVNADVNASAAIAGSKLSGAGISEADQWRLTTAFTGTSWDFSSNMERADHAGFSVLGTGMSESSGVFTYPSTGYWLVIFNQFVTANTNTRSIQSRILTTHDNSTYVTHYTTGGVVQAESNWTGDAQTNTIIQDVTNVSNDTVKFAGGSTQTVTVEGSSSANTTYMTFIRLGDT